MNFAATRTRPRLAFLGLGWIGRNRMEALAASGLAEIVGIADPSPEALDLSARTAHEAARGETLQDLLALGPDGLVIATPSALHSAQTIAALAAGAAVFCQKPLGRNAQETAAAVRAAREADRLLMTDLSYRYTAAVRAVAEEVRSGRLGELLAIDLTFHNAYGPDKPWFHDRALAGGGCIIDLGVHLIDLALWLLDWPEIRCTAAQLRSDGQPVRRDGAVEDFAFATLETDAGVPVRLACSWNLPAGCEAVIGMDLYGTGGGASVRNVNGSFYDFAAHRHDGCDTQILCEPPDDWGGRAAVDWAERLSRGAGYDPECERLVTVAAALDARPRHDLKARSDERQAGSTGTTGAFVSLAEYCSRRAAATPEAKGTDMPAKSGAQQKAAGAALSAKRGETKVSDLKGPAKDMYESMSEQELEEMAGTSRKDKPEHDSD